ICEAGVVVRGFDNDFVGTDAVHAVEHALGLAVEITLDSERRELVGDYAYGPARRVTLRRRSAIWIWAVGLNFGGSFGLVAVTEGAETTSDFYSIASEVGGPLRSIGGNDHPA